MNILITETQFKNLLSNNLLLEYSDSFIRKMVQKFKNETNVDENKIEKVIKKFGEVKDNPKILKKDITQYDWRELINTISKNKSTRIKAGKINDGEPSSDANLIYNQNGLRIYLGKTKETCIKYGNGYSFCISSRGDLNMYAHYRFDEQGTPYFIFDDTKTSKRYRDNEFVDNEHVLVLMLKHRKDSKDSKINKYFVITEANNYGDIEYNNYRQVEKKYPRLIGLEKIFEFVEPEIKEKEEYQIRKSYRYMLNRLNKKYFNDFDDKKIHYEFYSIDDANEKIDDLINGDLNYIRYVANYKKPNTSYMNLQYNTFVKKGQEDKIKEEFIGVLINQKYDERIYATIEEFLNKYDIYYEKYENKDYQKEVKNLIDKYREDKLIFDLTY